MSDPGKPDSHIESRPTSDAPVPDMGDDFSELARQRREDAEKESTLPAPNFVLGVIQAEFTVALDPQAVPLRYADPDILLRLMAEQYNATFESPDLGALIRETSIQAVQGMDESDLLRRAWKLGGASVEFKDGRLPTKYGFVPIRHVYIDFEKVFVAVQGITSLAEAVAYEVLELLWRSAGVERKYSEVEQSVRVVSYATRTRVDFGEAASQLLGEKLNRFLPAALSKGGQFAGTFGDRSHRHNFKPAPEVVTSVTLDELHIQVAQFNIGTGASYTGMLTFSSTAKDDHGTGRLAVASHLPYEEHVQLLAALRDALLSN
jgi:hypothetical protein